MDDVQPLDLRTIQSHENFLQPPEDEDTDNGYHFGNQYVPEEVLTTILSYVPIEYLLELSLVCKSWCKLIRSGQLWSQICKRTYNATPERYPWYVFYAVFSRRLNYDFVKNCNGKQSLSEVHRAPLLSLQRQILDLPCFGNPFRRRFGCVQYSSDINFLHTIVPTCHMPAYGVYLTEPYVVHRVSSDKLVLYIKSMHKF